MNKDMKQLIENLKAELQHREEQLSKALELQLNIDYTKGMIYALKTAIIFAEEGVNGQTIVRLGK